MVDFSPEDSAQDLDVLNLDWFHDQGIPERQHLTWRRLGGYPYHLK